LGQQRIENIEETRWSLITWLWRTRGPYVMQASSPLTKRATRSHYRPL